jgi:hypothetical protein
MSIRAQQLEDWRNSLSASRDSHNVGALGSREEMNTQDHQGRHRTFTPRPLPEHAHATAQCPELVFGKGFQNQSFKEFS